MKKERPKPTYYRVQDLVDMGYPKSQIIVLARKVNRHENPTARYNSPYILTLEEVHEKLGY